MKGSKAFESPLISHARMRAMYRALVETRVLGTQKILRHGSSRLSSQKLSKEMHETSRRQPPNGSGNRLQEGFPRGLEACWVGTAIGLETRDLVSDRRGSTLLTHVRSVGLRERDRGAHRSEIVRLHRTMNDDFPGSAADRMLCAIGAAMALTAERKNTAMLAYVAGHEMVSAEWRRILRVIAEESLPLVIVVTPGLTGKGVDLDRLMRRAGYRNLPLIPVDAADVVALYRVAQESLGRARAEGGSVLIECVATGLDPVKVVGRQLREKKICTERWLTLVETNFRDMLMRRKDRSSDLR